MNTKKIQNKLSQAGLDAIVLFSSENIRYACSFFITDGAAVISRSGAWLFTDSRYIEAAQKQAVGVEVVQCGGDMPLTSCIKNALAGCEKVGAEEQKLAYGQWKSYEERLGLRFIPAQHVLDELRAVKEQYEVDSIIAAQRIAESALDEVLGIIKPGMKERDIAAELTYRMMLHGAEGNSFDPICVTGAKSSMPHGVPGDEVVKVGDFLTMDFGCLKNGYCSDMTRTVAIGHVTDEMRKVYDTVLEAQLAGIAVAKAGVPGCDIHNAAAKVIADAGYGPYFGHGFGHSLGLEIHEAPNANPRNADAMPCGAVISAEPGIYLPGKFGVRIEDMLWLREDGCVNLTKAPKELLIV